MREIIFITLLTALSGCVDPAAVGIHPELRTAYYNGSLQDVSDCLISKSLNKNLIMQQDSSLPDGTYRYNILIPGGLTVAWSDISQFKGNQTAVSFYYAPKSPDLHKAIISITESCKKIY